MAAVHVARAFVDPTGKRWRVDGVSASSGAVHLVTGREERWLTSAELLAVIRRERWTAEAEPPAPSRPGA